jgi:hypothetical protein
LACFGRELDFEHDVERLAGFVQAAPRQLRRIHGLDAMKHLRGARALVALQVPDQMKSRAGEIADLGQLAGEFLHVVFAEFAQAQRVDVADTWAGKTLVTASSMICAPGRGGRGRRRASTTSDAPADLRQPLLQQAEADLAKAEFEIKRGPVLSEIDRLKNEQRAAIARLHVDSLRRSNALHDQADAAALRYLELQRDRQKVTLERYQNNIRLLEVHAPLAGMVAHEMVFRNNSMGHAQEGDQLYRGQPLVSIFDPTEMVVRCTVEEPDDVNLSPGATAVVYLDAYPELVLPAHLESSSPVAASALGSPIKTFVALFKLDKTDPHILPDLSAAVVIQRTAPGAAGGAE